MGGRPAGRFCGAPAGLSSRRGGLDLREAAGVAAGAEGDMERVAIITGGGRGIGAATARLAGARGYAVCVNYQRN